MPEAESLFAARLAAEAAAAGPRLELSPEQRAARLRFRAFVDDQVRPFADQWDREERMPAEAIAAVRAAGFLGAPLPVEHGGRGMDAITYGLLCEELASGCSSVRTLLTVHDMTALALLRWGSAELRRAELPAIARGELLCAFALSEPDVGSDASAVETEARAVDGGYLLSGRKRWISFGQVADRFLVFARLDGKPAAFFVDADAPGLERRPITGLLGTAASLCAELELRDCHVPAHRLVGKSGTGISHVASTALDHGRYAVAWGCVGIAQACLDSSLAYAASRRTFGVALDQHQLVRRLLTEMIVGTRAARLLCWRAGYVRQQGEPLASSETLVAKYFASQTASRVAGWAVQLHGAAGTSRDHPVARHLRDAKVMEIIEGSNEIQQVAIAGSVFAEL